MKTTMKKYRGFYIATIAMGCLAAFFMSRFSVYLGGVIDIVSTPDGKLAKSMLLCVAMLAAYLVFSFLFDYMEMLYVNKVVRTLKTNLYSALYQKELPQFFQKNNGDYLNMYSKDIDLLVDNYLMPKCSVVYNILSAAVCMISIFIINWKLGIAFVLISFVTVVLSQLPGAIMAKQTSMYSENSSRYLAVLENYLGGYEQVKLLGLGGKFSRKLDNSDGEYEKSRKNYLFSKIAANDLGMSFGMLSQLLCMSVGIYLVVQGSMTVGLLIAAVQLLNGVFSPLQDFVNDKNLMGTVKDILVRLDESQMTAEVDGVPIDQAIVSIELKNVSLSFGDKEIFHDYHVAFEKGKKYAVVGESGRGKSTLAKLIMKYLRENEYAGNVYINGVDVQKISSESLYQKIAYVQRNEFLVNGSVRDNILLFRTDVCDERLEKVCDDLKLDQSLRNKMIDASDIGDVSFGEKQRIDIARFMVGDYDTFIFDEPTSNLDSETAREINNMILGIKDKIVIVITHDRTKEYLDRFDEVIEL